MVLVKNLKHDLAAGFPALVQQRALGRDMAVSNTGRVNMDSQCIDTLLRLRGLMSSTAGAQLTRREIELASVRFSTGGGFTRATAPC
jgi:hypothetical protein